jgi:hypothetical protein
MNIDGNLLYVKCLAVRTDIFFPDHFAAGRGSRRSPAGDSMRFRVRRTKTQLHSTLLLLRGDSGWVCTTGIYIPLYLSSLRTHWCLVVRRWFPNESWGLRSSQASSVPSVYHYDISPPVLSCSFIECCTAHFFVYFKVFCSK